MRTDQRCVGFLSISSLIILGLAPSMARAATINVPADQPTIQAAINAASDGDTVLVAPGTYYENINFMGKAITVTSSGGPSVTTIDGGGTASVVTFDTNEGTSSVLSGFTITHGLGSTDSTGVGGGGIVIYSASPTVTGNVITNNDPGINGEAGGISAMMSSSAVIQGNVITANGSQSRPTGGVFIESSGTVQVSGNQISSNVGSGVTAFPGGSPLIEGNTISNNTTVNNGIGTTAGGGIFIYGPSTIIQNLISGNSADQGGGIYIEGDVPSLLINNTIVENASPEASGVYFASDPNSQFIDNLIVAAPGESALYCTTQNGALPPVVQSTDAFSSGGNGFDGACAGMAGANGNISADPLFLDGTGNFHLQYGSPAIDAGDNSAPDLPSTDLDGNARVVDGNNDGVATVDMGAYEFIPAADSISPSSLTFGSQQIGTSSSAQAVTITNTGSTILFLGISADANFAESNDCGASVAPGGNCTVSLTFAPTAAGTLNGNLNVRSNAAGSPQTVALSGMGFGIGAEISPSSLTFAEQFVGGTSAPQTVTLTNTGDQTLDLSGIGATGDFAETNNCGTTLAGGASCSISVSFTPTATGTRTGSVTVTDNAWNSPQSVSVAGTGTETAVTISPLSLDFGSQGVGITSSAQTITLTSSGSASLNISSISASGDFAETNNCGTSLAAGAACSVYVTFAPTTTGSRSGAISIIDNAPGSPQIVSLGGTGITMTVTLSPASLAFGNQTVLTTSAAQNVTLTNTGAATLDISTINISSSSSVPAGTFGYSNNCGPTLAVNASCVIGINFSPKSTGAWTAQLLVYDNAYGSPQSVSLSGTGTQAVAELSPTSLTFSSQLVGTISPPQTVTVTNTGNTTLTISGIATDNAFPETSNCGTSVAAGASCTISVTFAPTSSGTTDGFLTVTDPTDGTQSVALTGTAVTPALTLSPSSLSFGSELVNIVSVPRAVTVTNSSSATVSISSIGPSGDFAETNNCGASLVAGATCTVNVTFSPTSTGTRTGSITITDNGSGSPQSIPLSGTGVAPAASLSPASLDFGSQQLGTSSQPQAVTLTNTGSSTLNTSFITSGGDFPSTNNCGPSLAAGASCTISVTFTPSATGSRGGLLSVTDDAQDSPQTVSLSGTGTAPVVSLSPTSLSFAAQQVGTTSAARAVNLTNTGNANLVLSGIVASGDFAQTNNCGTSVAVNASCTITVTFTPTASGTRSGFVTITDNAQNSPHTIPLSGTGTAPAVSLSPTSLSFAGQQVGTSSAAQSVILTNTGSAALSISNIAASGDFAQANNCGASVAANASCSISITFTPAATGTRTGSVTITDNASGSPQSVSLSGTGTAPLAAASPASLNFGDQVVGTASAALSVTLSNVGNAPLTVSGITINGDFAETNNCGTTLAAGANCAISVTFTPTASGTRSGVLTVSSNSSGGPASVALAGNGAEYAPIFNPTSLTFSSQVVGTKSGGKTVKLTANGPGPLVISSITVTGDFLESNNCTAALNKGQSCNISINFLPTAAGLASGAIIVADNGVGSPQTVPLSGDGLDFTLSASPSSVTISAGQKAQYTVTATEAGGSFNNNVNLTCSGLPSGAKCQFSPSGIAPKTGSASSALTLQTTAGTSGTPSGSYPITIIGTSGSLQRSTVVTLVVN